NTTTAQSADQLDESHSKNAAKADNHTGETNHTNDTINIASPDWGNAATLTAMGHPPIATGDVRVWDRWVGTPTLPSSIIDLG
ncbi:hypothetical protein, partial [Pseudoalteromonas sp. AC40-MNA-CIBAN-0181]